MDIIFFVFVLANGLRIKWHLFHPQGVESWIQSRMGVQMVLFKKMKNKKKVIWIFNITLIF